MIHLDYDPHEESEEFVENKFKTRGEKESDDYESDIWSDYDQWKYDCKIYDKRLNGGD